MDKHLENQLVDFLRGRICVLGIGNRLRRDDGVGSVIAESMASCPGLHTINAGWVPENHFGAVARMKPDSILMIDAADFGAKPGQLGLLDPEQVTGSGLSTHTASLQMLAAYLRSRTRACVALLAIQPADTGAGEGLTADVAAAAEDVLQALPEVCRRARRRPGAPPAHNGR